jgi:hypothetical protein
VPIIFVVDPESKTAPVKPDAGLPPTRVEYNSTKTVFQAYNTTKQPAGGIGVELPPGPPKTIDEEGTISNAPIKGLPPRLPPIAEPPDQTPPIDEIGPQAGNGAADVYNPTAADVYNGRPPKLPPIVEPTEDQINRKLKIASENTGPFAPIRVSPGYEAGPSAPLQPAPTGKFKPIAELPRQPIAPVFLTPLEPIAANPIASITPAEKFAPIYEKPIASITPVEKFAPIYSRPIAKIDPIFEPYTAARTNRVEQPISLNPVNQLA